MWLNLYDLSRLRGQDGAAGQNGANGENGKDGKDGDTPFIGDNGNWWIGTTDTGVKAAGQDGAAGNDGAPGKDGSSPGWFFGEGYTQSVFLQDGAVTPKFREKLSSGGLVSCDGENLKLKKGHNYLVSVTGSVYAQTNDKSGNYSVQMTDGQNDALCRETTRTVVEKSTSGRAQQSIGFTRVYSAKDELTLKFALEQADYNTYLLSFRCTVTITALD